MKKKAVTVNVQIQMDIIDGQDEVGQVQDVLEAMNKAATSAAIIAEPQIFISDISNSDIIDASTEEEERDEEE